MQTRYTNSEFPSRFFPPELVKSIVAVVVVVIVSHSPGPVVLYSLLVSAQGVTGYSASLSVTLRSPDVLAGLGPLVFGLKYVVNINYLLIAVNTKN